MTKHTQLRCKCLGCNLHFVVCTWHPEKFTKGTVHCPECGQTGAFLIHFKEVDAPIFTVVPGDAFPFGGLVHEQRPDGVDPPPAGGGDQRGPGQS